MADRFRPPVPDAATVAELLTDRTGSRVSGVEPLVSGEWSSAYRFRQDGRDRVVRFSTLREDFDKDRLAARWSSADLPIPQILEVGEAMGGYYAVSEWADGGYIDVLDEAGMRRVLPALFGALDAARQIVVPPSGYGGWDADGRARHATWQDALLDVANDTPDRRGHGWRPRLAGSAVGMRPFDEALERMRSLSDLCPSSRHLVHGDLLHRNVLVDGARITAVLDWGCGMYGDFLYEIAWFTFWSPWFSAWSAIDFEREAARHYAAIGLHVPRLAARLRCYELHIGLSHLAYNAFRGDWGDLADVARRTEEVMAAAGP